MTSDQFFSELHFNELDLFPKFDIIYIDGLHHFEQVLRDFNNSLYFSHPDTIWIFDDTLPSDPYSSYVDSQKAMYFRRLAGVDSLAWHGDVYKFVFALHDLYPGFSYATVIDAGNPQTIVWAPPPRIPQPPLFKKLSTIDNLSFFDLLENYSILHPIENEDLLNIVGTPFFYPDYHKTIPLQKLCKR